MPESKTEDESGTAPGGQEAAAGAAHEDRTAPKELSRALGRLPADQREALLMVVLRGMSYEEVAEATGSTVSTAKSQVFWARRQLQAWLAGEVEDEASARESVGSQASPAPEGSAGERLAAEAVDRMIAALDAATATVEAQLAELRRMRRAA